MLYFYANCSMKYLLLVFFLCTASLCRAQEPKSVPTKSFTIGGLVETQSVITMDTLNRLPLQSVGDVAVTNHLGEFRHKDVNVKGVLLKDVLAHTVLRSASPKLLSRLYFTCIGSDGYKVVYSWNELYNTTVGDHVYIIMEKNGVRSATLPENIQMCSSTDLKTGRRYLQNLAQIVVNETN